MGPEGTAVSLETLLLSGIQSWGWFIKGARTPAGTSWLVLVLLPTAEMSLVVGVSIPTPPPTPHPHDSGGDEGCLKAPAHGPGHFRSLPQSNISWVERSGNRAFTGKREAKNQPIPH